MPSVFFCYWSALVAAEEPDIGLYGKLPEFRSVSISPDGQHYAYIRRVDNVDYFIVSEVAGDQKILFAGNTSEFKARSTSFATNEYALLRGSDTTRTIGYRGKRESSGTLAYNLKTGKVKTLFSGTRGIHPAQTGLGRITGLDKSGEYLYMPAYADRSPYPYNLYKVKLNTGYGKIHAKGNGSTVDWFVDQNGEVLAREDYKEKSQEHIVYSKLSGRWEKIYSLKTDVPEASFQAIDADGKSLLFVDKNDDREAVYKMNLEDGLITGPVFSREDKDISYLKTDMNRKLQAIVYSGFVPEYEFVDESEAHIYDLLAATFPASSVSYLSTTDDKNQVVVKVGGIDGADTFMLYNSQHKSLNRIASGYKVSSIGELKAVRYDARDGLKIPAVITFPSTNVERKDLPLIALPHGGPESYDSFRFDWMAQYFAAKGYMVLQPNFRGSTGFGYEFRNSGRGKWGREMQDDVSDGIGAVVEAGYADPDRVCIVGGSYGGYSALAGGAFDPDLYRCVISLNGVSDLPLMLGSQKRKYGADHWVISYWDKVIGDSKKEREKLKDISPINFAENFKAPVLLLHGIDDTVVPIRQSERMEKALRKAGKDVTLIKLKGEDHWLSTSTSRLETLQAMSDFLDLHNPVTN